MKIYGENMEDWISHFRRKQHAYCCFTITDLWSIFHLCSIAIGIETSTTTVLIESRKKSLGDGETGYAVESLELLLFLKVNSKNWVSFLTFDELSSSSQDITHHYNQLCYNYRTIMEIPYFFFSWCLFSRSLPLHWLLLAVSLVGAFRLFAFFGPACPFEIPFDIALPFETPWEQ